MIRLQPEAAEAIASFLREKGIKEQTLRIDIRSTGCCDPSLVLVAGAADPADLMSEKNGIILAIRPELHRQVGTVTVAYVNEPDRNGFVLTAENPVSEWEGFGVTEIEIQEGACS